MAKRGVKPKFTSSAASVEAAPTEVSMVLHPTQENFVACTKPHKAMVAGRGGGKSYTGAYDYLLHAPPKSVGMVISPTYRMMADSTQRSFIELATKMGLWNDKKFRKTDNVAILNDGREVLFRSGDEPNKIRGSSVAYIWADECSLLKEEVYSIAIACLRWGGRQGTFTGTFTPSGKDHWTYRVFSDKTNPHVELFHCSTRDNPFLPEEFYATLVTSYGKGEGGQLRALQELEGEFVCVEGAEWGPENFQPHIWFRDWPEDEGALRAVALDSSKGIGGKTGDYSVFAIGMYAAGKVWIEFDADNRRNASQMVSRAIEIQRDFRPHLFGVESEFGGAVLVDDLETRAEAAGLLIPLVLIPTQGMQKDVRIRRLTPYLSNDILRFRDNEMTRLGLQSFESWPFSSHDDFEDSCEMLLQLINQSGAV